ncbi:MAG: hypothetical protein HGA46_10270 [Chlorobiaceae bacterium]|nr:hypothetical protein [Chlorobiaceae bacterium]
MQFIDNADGEFETFSLAPKKPGTIRAAAFDYAVILNAAGSVASIAALLWMAYDKFIAPKKRACTMTPGYTLSSENLTAQLLIF